MLGIASRSYFTLHYLSPLAKAAYIAYHKGPTLGHSAPQAKKPSTTSPRTSTGFSSPARERFARLRKVREISRAVVQRGVEGAEEILG